MLAFEGTPFFPVNSLFSPDVRSSRMSNSSLLVVIQPNRGPVVETMKLVSSSKKTR